MRKFYFVFCPSIQGSLTEEWEQCLKQIRTAVSSEYTAIKLNVFADLPDFSTFLLFREVIIQSVSENFGNIYPAINITIHPPEKPWKIAVELTALLNGSVEIISKSYDGVPYIVIESDAFKEVWSAGVSSYKYPGDTFKAANDSFAMMVNILAIENMTLNNIVRQWNYIGNILSTEGGSQNYQIFNEVRNDFYSRYRNVKGYPAATGVGMKSGNVALDFCALDLKGSPGIVAVNNPDQINAYDYGQEVLKGFLVREQSEKHPPKFERALIIKTGKDLHLHISGTASIIGQETIGRDDIEQQTLVTIRNLFNLTDKGYISSLLNNVSISDEKYSLIRVYIKSQKDFKIVREICDQHFRGIPALYIEADICRDDLLMEIEAEVELNQ
jgi:hypothetical protein